MSTTVYKTIEITGTSPNSIEEAVGAAVARAGASIRQMRWFEVTEMRGAIDENQIAEWQVTVKIGFHLEP